MDPVTDNVYRLKAGKYVCAHTRFITGRDSVATKVTGKGPKECTAGPSGVHVGHKSLPERIALEGLVDFQLRRLFASRTDPECAIPYLVARYGQGEANLRNMITRFVVILSQLRAAFANREAFQTEKKSPFKKTIEQEIIDWGASREADNVDGALAVPALMVPWRQVFSDYATDEDDEPLDEAPRKGKTRSSRKKGLSDGGEFYHCYYVSLVFRKFYSCWLGSSLIVSLKVKKKFFILKVLFMGVDNWEVFSGGFL